ncbi:MAG: hypothetical protein ACLTLL_01650 [Acutalibacteraceae bacterium]
MRFLSTNIIEMTHAASTIYEIIVRTFDDLAPTAIPTTRSTKNNIIATALAIKNPSITDALTKFGFAALII